METTLYYDALIKFGNTHELPTAHELDQYGLSKRIMLPEGWKSISNANLISLFKGLVLLEEYWFTNGEHIGSTTDTKFVYREILSRGLDLNYILGDWAFQYSSNPYVPMDTGNRHGAKTIYELFDWEREYSERIIREQVDSMKKREEKKRLKAEAHAERLRQKEIRDKMLGYKK